MNFLNWKNNKFPEFYTLKNLKYIKIFSIWKTIEIPKTRKFWNFLSIQYSALLAILPILIFALWYKWILTRYLLNFYFLS